MRTRLSHATCLGPTTGEESRRAERSSRDLGHLPENRQGLLAIEADEIRLLTGTYALILRATEQAIVPVNRSGTLLVHVREGFYVYIGSACGSGGLPARLGHHARPALNPVWHVDRLKVAAPLQEAWYSFHDRGIRRECMWSAAVGAMPGATVPLNGVGNTDCRICPAHLYFFEVRPSLSTFRTIVNETIAENGPVYRLNADELTKLLLTAATVAAS